MVARGKDTLLISLCHNPSKCVVDPALIDSSVSPFKEVVKLSVNKDLDDEEEAERAMSHSKRKPLSCFGPAKWTLLEDGPSRERDTPPLPQQEEEEPPKMTGKAEAAWSEPQSKSDIPSVEVVAYHEDKQAKEVESEAAGDFQGGIQDADTPFEGHVSAQNQEEGDSSVKSNEVEKVESGVGKATKDETFLSKTFFGDGKNQYAASSISKDDEKAVELIKKYLSFSEHPSEHTVAKNLEKENEENMEEEEEKWPYVKPRINEDNRASYRMLTEQLNDAKRLMDMPLRKREKRLWKLPVIPTSTRSSKKESTINVPEGAGKTGFR